MGVVNHAAISPRYRLVDVPESRRPEQVAVDHWAFPTAMTEPEALALPSPLSWERARGVQTADGELVATHASYPFTGFPVPGARTAVSGLTWVGVHPAHRRRGLLTAMMTEHFSRSLARGEAVSALFAAEAAIYGRFGYGLAAHDLRVQVPRGARLRDVPGAEAMTVRLEVVEAERHGPLVEAVHAAVDRPGWARRETPQLRAHHLSDPPAWRDGAEPLRIAVVEDGGRPTAYALFRRRSAWEDAGPRGTVRVREVVAPGAAAARALWGVLVDLDLMATVEAGLLATDDPITHLLVDPRAARPRLADNLWVRLLDVPKALGARRYAAPVDVVLEVTDTRLPTNAGRWRLVGDTAHADVAAADRPADLSLDVRELGSAYLGGVSLAGLAAAGLVTEHTPGSLARAATAFGWPTAPVSSFLW